MHQKGSKDLFTAQSFIDKIFLSLHNTSAVLFNLSSNSTPSIWSLYLNHSKGKHIFSFVFKFYPATDFLSECFMGFGKQ